MAVSGTGLAGPRSEVDTVAGAGTRVDVDVDVVAGAGAGTGTGTGTGVGVGEDPGVGRSGSGDVGAIVAGTGMQSSDDTGKTASAPETKLEREAKIERMTATAVASATLLSNLVSQDIRRDALLLAWAQAPCNPASEGRRRVDVDGVSGRDGDGCGASGKCGNGSGSGKGGSGGLRRSHRRKQSIVRITELADGLSTLRKNITQVLSKTFSGDLLPSPLRLPTRFSFHSPLPDVRPKDSFDADGVDSLSPSTRRSQSHPYSPASASTSVTATTSVATAACASPAASSSVCASASAAFTDRDYVLFDPAESCDELMDPVEYALFATGVQPFARVRVLLFDESRRVMRHTAKVLEKLGCAVTCAYGYEDALGKITTQPFDVAVVDFIPVRWLGTWSCLLVVAF